MRHYIGGATEEGAAAAGAGGFTVVLVGGVVRPEGLVARRLGAKVAEALPGARCVHPEVGPDTGAALLGCELVAASASAL